MTAPGSGKNQDQGGGAAAGSEMAAVSEVSGVPETDRPAPGDIPEQDHDVAAVLRVTSFRRLWLALSGSSFGDWLGLLATTALAQQYAQGSYAEANLAVASVLILRLAPAVVFGPLAGALADRMNRKFVMVSGDVLRGLLFITIPIVNTYVWLLVATLLIECLALFWSPAKEATVPNLVPRNRLEAANQMSLVTTYGTAPIAALVFSGISLLNGILDNFLDKLSTNPIALALYLNAATFIISGIVISRLNIPEPSAAERAQKRETESVVRSITEGWRFIGNTPVIRGLVVGMLGAFAAAGFVIGLAQTYVKDLGAGQPGYGALFAAVFFGLAIGMWLGPRLLNGFSRYRLFALSLVTSGAFLAALALIPNMVMAVIFTLCLGACGGVAWVTGYTLLGLTVDDAVRGRTFAFIGSASRVVLVAVLAIGPALAGIIGRHTVQFTDTRQLTYNGAAFVLLLAAVLASGLGVAAYRQMDDRPGARLLHDFRQLWSDRKDQPSSPARVRHPGVFVAFEGGDGTGKSTQARLLADWVREDQGHEVVLTREPGATPLGGRLRQMLLERSDEPGPGARAEALLFAADRAHHVDCVIHPALEAGAVVITDRYVDSSVAYQGAGRDLEADDVARISRWATDGLVPDLTIVLDVDPVISKARRERDAQRNGEDRLESQPDDFHARVRGRFLEQARKEPHRYLVVDAGLTVDEIQALARARVRELLPISARRRAELNERLTEEGQHRTRRAAAEEEVLRMDADLRERGRREVQQREESRRRAREEAERQLADEAQRGETDPTAPVDTLSAAAEQAYAAPPPDHPAEAEVEAIGRAADAVSRAADNPLPSITSPIPRVTAETATAARAAESRPAEPAPAVPHERTGTAARAAESRPAEPAPAVPHERTGTAARAAEPPPAEPAPAVPDERPEHPTRRSRR